MNIYICEYIYLNIYRIYEYIYIYIHICIYEIIYTCTVHIYIYIHSPYVCICLSPSNKVHIVCVYIYIYVYTCDVSVYIYIDVPHMQVFSVCVHGIYRPFMIIPDPTPGSSPKYHDMNATEGFGSCHLFAFVVLPDFSGNMILSQVVKYELHVFFLGKE